MTALNRAVEQRVTTSRRALSQDGVKPFSIFTTDQPRDLIARDFVVDQLIERENIVLLIGYPGSAKSSLAMHMLGCVASSINWFEHKITGSHSALLFAPERSKEMMRRMRAFEQHFETDVSALGIISDDIDLAHGEEHARRVVATVLDHEQRTGRKAGLICFDTFFDLLHGGDENHPRDMGSVVRNLQLIRRETNTPIITICHPSMDRPHEPRGHKSSLAKADLTVVVGADGKSDSKRWHVKKTNGLEHRASGVFTLKSVFIDDNSAPVVIAGGAQAPAGSKGDVVCRMIADTGGQIVMSDLVRKVRDADQFKGMAQDACRIAVDRLVKAMASTGTAEVFGKGKDRKVRVL